MKPRLLELLECPHCRKADFEVDAQKSDGDDVVEGLLRCKACRAGYPIRDSVVFFEISQAEDKASAWNEVFSAADPAAVGRDIERTRKNVDSGMAVQGCMMARLLKRDPSPFASYLDIGCGSGFFSWYIHSVRPGMRLTLLDYSVPGVLRARETMRQIGVDADFVQGTAMNLPFKADAFDLSSTAGLLEHFLRPDQDLILKEQARSSRHNLCQAPIDTPWYWMLRKYVEWRQGKWPFGFEVPLKPAFLRQILKDNRWEISSSTFQSLPLAFLLHGLRFRSLRGYRALAFAERLFSYDACHLCRRLP